MILTVNTFLRVQRVASKHALNKLPAQGGQIKASVRSLKAGKPAIYVSNIYCYQYYQTKHQMALNKFLQIYCVEGDSFLTKLLTLRS